jgi:DNA-binding LytR/AlgR family response regulator
MKAIIIEDEKLSAEHLETLLRKIDAGIEIVARFDSIKKSVVEFNKGLTADLLFVDIHLADGLSFDIFSQTKITVPVIFTTAFDEYAIKAFKVNSIDYLLKPIGINDLKVALSKFRQINNSVQINQIETISQAYQNHSKPYKNRFMVKIGDTISSIKTEDISYFISEEGAVLLVCDSKRYMIDYTLDTLETMVSPDTFFRINRKVIIHIATIKKINSYFNGRLKINSNTLGEEDGIVSRERVQDFKAWLDK